jgi:hypothetical protein
MPNFRKTRKRGGQQFIPDVYACADVDSDRCADEFAGSQGWNVISTADNGNCFYDSLAKYYQKTKNADKAKRSNRELRKMIINAIITRRAEYAHVFVSEDPNAPEMTNADILAELQEYLKPYQWAGPLGDVVPSVAAHILDINITIYDTRDDGRVNMIAMGTGPNGIPNPGLPTINLIRTNGNHFQLLWPIAAPPPVAPARKIGNPKVAPLSPPARASSPHLTTRQRAAAAAQAASPPRRTARRKPVVAPAPASNSNSNSSINSKYANNLQKALIASLKNAAVSKTAKKGKAKAKPKKNNENAKLAAATAASLAIAKPKPKPKPNFVHGSKVFN